MPIATAVRSIDHQLRSSGQGDIQLARRDAAVFSLLGGGAVHGRRFSNAGGRRYERFFYVGGRSRFIARGETLRASL